MSDSKSATKPKKNNNECQKCKSDLKNDGTIEVKAPAPYNTKIVCKNCKSFVGWGRGDIEDVMAENIDKFFNDVELHENIHTSIFYQWHKKRKISGKQLEVLLKHPMWTY